MWFRVFILRQYLGRDDFEDWRLCGEHLDGKQAQLESRGARVEVFDCDSEWPCEICEPNR
jgi:hypothetical protein